jgi:hypothetical protein
MVSTGQQAHVHFVPPQGVVIPPIVTPSIFAGGKSKKKNKWRDYIARLAQDVKRIFFYKPPKPEEEEEEIEVEIPPTQPPKTTTILAGPPTEDTKLETINDKWSVVASTPPPEARTEVIYPPIIINPATSPLIQKKTEFPKSHILTQTMVRSEPYAVGEGRHIDTYVAGMKRPINRSKVASVLQKLMILSYIN